MKQLNLSPKNSIALISGAIFTVVFIVIVTLAADLFPALKDWLKATFTHHWIGKGVIAVGLFVVVSAVVRGGLKQPNENSIPPLLKLLTILTSLGTILIFGFFLYETFLK